ncbi:MAG: hypothetical protein D6803_06905 [Anaerolineae bacterium]|nr:MAG: hypothetical protein D6803_06905 [Anaerolineae bacterium]
MDLPPEFVARMQNLLGEESADFLATYQQPPTVGLRVNTLKLTPQRFEALSPFSLQPIPWAPAGFLVPPDERPGKHVYHTAGLYYLQDPSAMAVAALTSPRPGERVLDLAAAPGGKATHLAALMQGRGLLVANDLHPRRVHTLARNLERWGATNAVVLNETPDRLAAHFGAYFDRVVVDAPCSGEGMFRKDPQARREWSPTLVLSCARRQDAILHQAARLVRPGGLLVYATCTFAPQENEGTLARFLEAHPDYELESPPLQPGFAPARPEWVDAAAPSLASAVRLWPHRAPGEGHFIALLRRSTETEAPSPSLPPQAVTLPREVQKHWHAFAAQVLAALPDEERIGLFGSRLYRLPPHCPSLRGLRVIHWGWWLGTARKNRFEPAHALAMGKPLEQFRRHLALARDDPRLGRFLRGEVISAEGAEGWLMLAVDGFPLGWGKRVGARIKPHLPRWLRQFE